MGSAPELFGEGLDQRQAFELMDAAWELGIRHFDTADAYGGGRSELMIGAWIRTRGVLPRLTTKTFNPMFAGADHGLAPERILRQLDGSLERLGIERVDLYLAHDYDPAVALEDTFEALESRLAAGLIGAYGLSNFSAAELEAALAVGAPRAVQNSYSLLDRADEDSVLPACAASGVAYLAFGPLAGGWLTGKYRRNQPFPTGSRMTQRPEPYARLVNDSTFDALERLRSFAADRRTSIAAVALAWLLADDRVTQVVTGPGEPAHLAPVGEALAHPVSDDERVLLDSLFKR